jgi:hypothetical protein
MIAMTTSNSIKVNPRRLGMGESFCLIQTDKCEKSAAPARLRDADQGFKTITPRSDISQGEGFQKWKLHEFVDVARRATWRNRPARA